MVIKLPWTSVGANIVRNRDTEENDLGLLLASGKHTKDHPGMCKQGNDGISQVCDPHSVWWKTIEKAFKGQDI